MLFRIRQRGAISRKVVIRKYNTVAECKAYADTIVQESDALNLFDYLYIEANIRPFHWKVIDVILESDEAKAWREKSNQHQLRR